MVRKDGPLAKIQSKHTPHVKFIPMGLNQYCIFHGNYWMVFMGLSQPYHDLVFRSPSPFPTELQVYP
jgi:hypothetical protein